MTKLTGLGPLCFPFYCVIDFAWVIAVSGNIFSSGTILVMTLYVPYMFDPQSKSIIYIILLNCF